MADFSNLTKLAAQGWLFTSHKLDLSGAKGHGADTQGLTLEQATSRFSDVYQVIGLKGGVQLADGSYSLILDCDAQGYFEKVQEKLPILKSTLQHKGSKLGHFVVKTDCPVDKQIVNLSDGKTRAIDILGVGGMAVAPPSRHRKTKKTYEIINDAEPVFIAWQDIKAALFELCIENKLMWPEVYPPKETRKQQGTITVKDETKDKIRRLVRPETLGLKSGRQDCKLHTHTTPEGTLHVYEDGNGFWAHCFSKDESMDCFAVYMAQNNCSFVKAKRELGKLVGIEEELEIKRFIFDEDRVNKKKIFPAGKIDGKHYFGLLIPRWKDVYNKKGVFVKTIQVEAPALITSDHELLPVGEELLTKYKIWIDNLPAEYPLRWTLPAVYNYVKNGSKATSGKNIFEKICKMYEKYLYFHHPEWYEVHALWDLGTYFFTDFYYYPIFELRGVKGSAKNKIMAISRGFTFNATDEMTNPSEATLFHDTAERRPTKYIDEVEKLFVINKGKAEPDNRAELLNASYKYTGTVPRMEKFGGKYVKISYSVYSPTMLASINGLCGATEDRAIIHITTKAPKGDGRANLEPNPNDQTFEEVRNELYVFALENAAFVEKTYNEIEVNGLTARELFLWKPLFTLAKLIDSEVYKRLITFAQTEAKIKELGSVSEDSTEWRILKLAYEQLEAAGAVGVLAKKVHEDWRAKYGAEYAPHSKTIIDHLDRFGLRQYKEHFALGNGYRITKTEFEALILTSIPSFFTSLASAASETRDKTANQDMKKNEGNEENKEKKKEVGQQDLVNTEANEDMKQMKVLSTPSISENGSLLEKLTQAGSAGISVSLIRAQCGSAGIYEISTLAEQGLVFFDAELGKWFAKGVNIVKQASVEG